MSILKIVLALVALVNRLTGVISDRVLRRRIWKEYHHEQLAKRSAKLLKANKARRARRNADRTEPDSRLQDDGFRRD